MGGNEKEDGDDELQGGTMGGDADDK